jgi:hypothetical protein
MISFWINFYARFEPTPNQNTIFSRFETIRMLPQSTNRTQSQIN